MSRSFPSLDPGSAPQYWWHRWQLSTQKFAVLLTVTAFVTGFMYVLLTNQTASEGFAIKSLQNKVDALAASNEKLELKAADLRSLSVISAASNALALQPTDKFEYLPPATGAVALAP